MANALAEIVFDALAVNAEKAIPILRVIQDDLNKINEKVKSVDNKIFGKVEGQTTITADAMSYKEELLRKKREKEQLTNAMSEMDSKLTKSNVINSLKELDEISGEEEN